MPSASSYAVFVVAALTLLAIPGPAVLYIVGQSIDGGRRAGLASVLGITTGTLVHIAAAVAGLSALILGSAVAFDVVKFVGAAYLIVLGVRRLLTRSVEAAPLERAPATLRRAYGRGVVVNVLNPKTALFFLAFVPQFVDVSAGHVWLQILVPRADARRPRAAQRRDLRRRRGNGRRPAPREPPVRPGSALALGRRARGSRRHGRRPRLKLAV